MTHEDLGFDRNQKWVPLGGRNCMKLTYDVNARSKALKRLSERAVKRMSEVVVGRNQGICGPKINSSQNPGKHYRLYEIDAFN